MPTPAPSPEAVARAILEKPPATGPLSPAQERAKALRQKTTKEGPRSTLEALRKPVQRADALSLLDRNFGVDIDPATGNKIRVAGSLEEIRFNQSKEKTKLYSDYIEKGFEPLTVGEKALLKGELKGVLTAWPPGQQFINALTAAEQDELYETILKGQEEGDIKLPATVRKLLEERAQGVIADEVTEKKRRFDELQQKETEVQNQVTLNATDLTNVNTNLAQFEIVGGTTGAKLRELERLQKSAPRLTQQREEKQDQLDNAKAQLVRLENQRDMLLLTGRATVAIDALITTKETAISGLKTEVSQTQQQLDRKQALETEKTSLESRKQTLEAEKARLQQQLQDALRQRMTAQADFTKAKIERGEKEEKFADSIKNLFSDASMKYFMDKIQAMETADKQLFEEEKAKAVDPAEKAIYDGFNQKWEKDKTIGLWKFGKRTVRVIDEKAIASYADKVITAHGDPKQAMKDMLTSMGVAAADADVKVNDTAFMAKMAPKFMDNLMTKWTQIGKMSENDARILIGSQYGDAAINQAINNNKNLKDAIQKLRDQGVIEGSVSDWLKNKSGGSFWKALLLLLGVVAVTVPTAGLALKVLNP